jgi:triacylglycerol esterase/lipase EstA (alpha/beta hydrolase family)
MSTTLKPLYGSSAALTVTHLASLASDSSLLAGWSSAVIANGTNLSVTEKISGLIETGTSPTVGTNIFIYLWAALDDTPTYPDTITGSEATKTLTSTNVRDAGAFKLAQVITVTATSNIVYPFEVDVSQWFGGHMPKNYGVFIVHNTGVSLNATQVVSRADVTQYQNV